MSKDVSRETAERMMSEVRERGWEDWGLVERVLAKAFLADWYSERPRSDWVRLAEALESVTLQKSEKTVKRAFNRMVRAGYLYSCAGRNERNYGINFK